MKILFNCTNNTIGGAVQNSANFIKLAIEDKEHIFLFLVSDEVNKVLLDWNIIDNSIKVINRKNKNIFDNEDILDAEFNFSPDLVYTMAGPTYINFKNKHIMGISDGYITHSKIVNFTYNRKVKESFIMLIKTIFKGLFSRFSADYFVFQTNTARNGYCERFFLKKTKTFVINNSINEKFLNFRINSKSQSNLKNIRVLCPSAYYSHKDIEVIFKISDLIFKENLNLDFILTINHNDFDELCKKYGKKENITNIGPYSYANALEIYEKGDVIILPSTLETFSTTYIEAIALGKPLIVADASFSREICGDYAKYFKMGDEYSLLKLFIDNNFIDYNPNLEQMNAVISKYGTQMDRYKSIIEVLKSLYR